MLILQEYTVIALQLLQGESRVDQAKQNAHQIDRDASQLLCRCLGPFPVVHALAAIGEKNILGPEKNIIHVHLANETARYAGESIRPVSGNERDTTHYHTHTNTHTLLHTHYHTYSTHTRSHTHTHMLSHTQTPERARMLTC